MSKPDLEHDVVEKLASTVQETPNIGEDRIHEPTAKQTARSVDDRVKTSWLAVHSTGVGCAYSEDENRETLDSRRYKWMTEYKIRRRRLRDGRRISELHDSIPLRHFFNISFTLSLGHLLRIRLGYFASVILE
jgi:hypothetical protein